MGYVTNLILTLLSKKQRVTVDEVADVLAQQKHFLRQLVKQAVMNLELTGQVRLVRDHKGKEVIERRW